MGRQPGGHFLRLLTTGERCGSKKELPPCCGVLVTSSPISDGGEKVSDAGRNLSFSKKQGQESGLSGSSSSSQNSTEREQHECILGVGFCSSWLSFANKPDIAQQHIGFPMSKAISSAVTLYTIKALGRYRTAIETARRFAAATVANF
jgi:hypothetical protein